MNILICTNSLCYGGAESFSIQLYEKLKQSYNTSYLIFSDDTKILERFQDTNASEIFSTNKGSKGFLSMLSQIFKVYNYIKHKKIDVVYCSMPPSALVFWIIKLFYNKFKIIYITMHVYENAVKNEKALWKTGLPNKSTDKFFGLSDYLSQQLINKNKANKEKVLTNRLPVDTQKFSPDTKLKRIDIDLPEDKKILGICCRLHPQKRVHLFIETFRFLEDKNVIGVIYGEGEEYDKLVELIGKYNLKDKVLLRPFIDNVNEVIPLFDIYLQTVSGPNLGLVTLEAFSCGVPVIMLADNDEEKYMIEDTYCGQNVGGISSTEPKTIAATVEDLLNNNLDQVKLNCRKLALEQYSWKQFMNINEIVLKGLF
ncbi:glycosyltransferase [Chryseobacterium indologenes]|uniref:glycosyltransferase n=1 Tax=Chryseobacterium indologenes TaxID=253 RepID=UPI0003E08556|nr:glycosyltransferase [Chryseobacterium indologenes]QPQ52429.1 glycosyltransferase [Chryseobacterium indologenes]GAE64702.1 putative glycosyltransferase [Chryseobacterium indologenes NBRC 14944]SFJ85098.1 Glycosyltransferase involved in cell wall bisynthesis [Chryseobacterium indologenes]SUX51072.1 UDP-D-galactose:(glucosyl)lipopolysaccharide-1,6-D-galactosyltransferase [Chryseobacterium indologenes]